jgi:hypothetical protein
MGDINMSCDDYPLTHKRRHHMGIKDVSVILQKQRSLHPDDSKLSIVLAKNHKGEFVTWSYNAEFDGFDSGHYFPGTIEGLTEAIKDYNERGIAGPPSVDEKLVKALKETVEWCDANHVVIKSALHMVEMEKIIKGERST